MELRPIKSLEGSPQPSDIFQPHMPGVNLLSDMTALFNMARSELLDAESHIEKSVKGRRAIAIVTPERLIMYEPCPLPGSLPPEHIEPIKELMPSEPSLNMSVVSYTFIEAFLQDKTKTKCIPFLGILLSYGYLGHSVVVFEGHPSAFESGVRNSDVLLVDSGMLPFIQNDWVEVALRVMRPGARIFVHDRDTFTFLPVARSNNAQGWQYSEPDGEASYANCLLMTLAKGARSSVQVTSGHALPNLADLTTDLNELDWIYELPFKYDQLDADKVIEIILRAAGWRWYHFFKTTGTLTARLVDDSGKSNGVLFNLRVAKDAAGKRQLQIER